MSTRSSEFPYAPIPAIADVTLDENGNPVFPAPQSVSQEAGGHTVTIEIDATDSAVNITFNNGLVTRTLSIGLDGYAGVNNVFSLNPNGLRLSLDGATQLTVGAAGGAAALPLSGGFATPSYYMEIFSGYVVPLFAKS